MPSDGKRKTKREGKTETLNRINREWISTQEKFDENENLIRTLEAQYQVDADVRLAYKKKTYEKLASAYDKRERYSVKLEQKKTEYAAADAELESSSSDESRRSVRSWQSASSKSSNPAMIGWDCGMCRRTVFNDPWGQQNWCGCGHQYCDNDSCCIVQWAP